MLKILETKYKIRQIEIMSESYQTISKQFLVAQSIYPSYSFFWTLPENRLLNDISLRQRRQHPFDYLNIDWSKFPVEEKLILSYRTSDDKVVYKRADFIEIENILYLSSENTIQGFTIESTTKSSIKHKWCMKDSEKDRVNSWALEVLFEDFESLSV